MDDIYLDWGGGDQDSYWSCGEEEAEYAPAIYRPPAQVPRLTGKRRVSDLATLAVTVPRDYQGKKIEECCYCPSLDYATYPPTCRKLRKIIHEWATVAVDCPLPIYPLKGCADCEFNRHRACLLYKGPATKTTPCKGYSKGS